MTGRPSVLVVDDEEDVVAYLAAALEDHGFGVVTVADAEEAAARLREALPDLVVLDIMMPGHSGLTFYRELRTNAATRHLPVVFLSGCTAAEAVASLRETGVNGVPPPLDYFEKPVALGAFLDRVQALLQGAPAGGRS